MSEELEGRNNISEKEIEENLSQQNIVQEPLTDIAKRTYLDYSMSVIIGRAIPDVRDGLKPVHRRILQAMSDLNITPKGQYKKSARVVGDCLVGGTLVSTKTGLTKIENVDVGDEVFTQNGLKKVTELFYQEPQELIKTTMRGGLYSNISTKNHKFKILNTNGHYEFKAAQDLTLEDYIVMEPSLNDIKDDFEEEEMYVLGALLSDGNIDRRKNQKSKRLVFSSTDIEILNRVSSFFLNKFQIETRKSVGKDLYILKVSSKVSLPFIEKFSLNDKYANSINKILEQLYKFSNKSIISFLSGFIDGDGFIRKNRREIVITSIDKKFLDSLAILIFDRFGILAHISINKEKGAISQLNGREMKSNFNCYNLVFTGEDTLFFKENLKLSHPKRKRRLAEMDVQFQPTLKKIIPYYGKIIFDIFSEKHTGSGWYIDKDGKKFRDGIKYPNGTKIRYSKDLNETINIYSNSLERMNILNKLEKLGENDLVDYLNNIIEKKIRFLKIKEIKSVDADITYDFTVEDEHEFFANGIVSSNCIGKYHPHGDSSVYDAMVGMSQDYNIREPIIDGQGNWGNIDGDKQAAMRYCLTGDALIKTNKGMIPIKNLVKDPSIQEQDIDIQVYSLGNKLNKASKFFNSGIHSIIKLEAEGSYSIKGSLNHPVLILKSDDIGGEYYSWKTLEDINIGDLLVVQVDDKEGYSYKKITKLKLMKKKEEVFSIRVDSECHSFIANGIVNHNTECRLTSYGYAMLNNIEKKSVDYRFNFDESEEEPVMLPAMLPNILVNGTEGIAVGMATNMAPHNVNEVIKASISMLKNPDISVSQLRRSLKGPDMPTGGILMKDSLDKIYETGAGRFYIKAKYHTENDGRLIVIDEIPFQTKKPKIIVQIAELVRDKQIFGITGAQDESNKDGLRLVISIKRGENIKIIMNSLFKKTDLQMSYSIKNLVIDNGEPVVLNLKQLIGKWITFRKDIVTKDIQHDIDKLNKKMHLLRGIVIALNNLDKTLKIIRGSKDSTESKALLIEEFFIDEAQAQGIIDTKLQKLSSMESDNLKEDLRLGDIEISRLETLISTDEELTKVIVQELTDLNKKIKSKRKTEITDDDPFISNEELITDEDVAIIITKDGFIRKTSLDNFKAQHRGGKGKSIITLREKDFVKKVLFCKNNEHLTVFTKNNKAFALPVYTITESTKGRLVTNLIEDDSGVFDIIHSTKSSEMVFVTRSGQVVKLAGKHFLNIRKNGIKAIRLGEGDKLVKVLPIESTGTHIMITTNEGYTMTTELSKFRTSGRGTIGVKGMSLKPKNYVVDTAVVNQEDKVLLISEKGYGKQNAVSEFRVTNRGSKGVKSFKISEKTGNVVGLIRSKEDNDLVVTTKQGTVIRTPISKISTNNNRVTVGVKIIDIKDNDLVISFDSYEKNEME